MLRNTILKVLADFSESHALLECAKLSGTAFALRGGIVRNLIVAAAKRHPVPEALRPSMFDLVDPFSDIDIVVDELVQWSRISACIAAALPLASYFRWEFSSLQQIKRLKDSYEDVPLDRFLLWFHADGKTVTLDQFEGEANDVYKLLLNGRIKGLLPEDWRDHPDKFALTLAAALKLIRYKHQFGLEVPNPQDWVKEVVNAKLEDTARQRIELHVLDALFTAEKTITVLPDIQAVLNKVEPTQRDSGFFGKVKNLSATSAPEGSIRAIVTPANAASGVKTELDDTVLSPELLIPWTTLQTGMITNTGTTDCCDYLASGPIVVAVRPAGSFHATLGRLNLNDMGVQARTDIQIQSTAEMPEDLDAVQHRFAVPALHMAGAAGILRIDPRYPRAVLGDNKKWQVSLQKISEPQSSQ